MYLTPDDVDAFLDLEKQEPQPNYGMIHECPKCKGHGYWNLRINAYRGDTPAQRHFRACCSVCYGWGYTSNPNQCSHEWQWERNTGKCLNQYRCTVCNAITEWDSSD